MPVSLQPQWERVPLSPHSSKYFHTCPGDGNHRGPCCPLSPRPVLPGGPAEGARDLCRPPRAQVTEKPLSEVPILPLTVHGQHLPHFPVPFLYRKGIDRSPPWPPPTTREMIWTASHPNRWGRVRPGEAETSVQGVWVDKCPSRECPWLYVVVGYCLRVSPSPSCTGALAPRMKQVSVKRGLGPRGQEANVQASLTS